MNWGQFLQQGVKLGPGGKVYPLGRSYSLGVDHHPSFTSRGEHTILFLNMGNFIHKGQSSPLRASFTPRGHILPSGAILKSASVYLHLYIHKQYQTKSNKMELSERENDK
jgi:hypothetical protein